MQEKEEETSTADQIDALSKTIIREHHHQGGKVNARIKAQH